LAPAHTPSPCPCARRVRRIARSPCPLLLPFRRPEEPHLTESEVRARSNTFECPRLPRPTQRRARWHQVVPTSPDGGGIFMPSGWAVKAHRYSARRHGVATVPAGEWVSDAPLPVPTVSADASRATLVPTSRREIAEGQPAESGPHATLPTLRKGRDAPGNPRPERTGPGNTRPRWMARGFLA